MREGQYLFELMIQSAYYLSEDCPKFSSQFLEKNVLEFFTQKKKEKLR